MDLEGQGALGLSRSFGDRHDSPFAGRETRLMRDGRYELQKEKQRERG